MLFRRVAYGEASVASTSSPNVCRAASFGLGRSAKVEPSSSGLIQRSAFFQSPVAQYLHM